MDAWGSLQKELDCWMEDARTATFWWRDDDAAAITPSLEKLLALSTHANIPMMLAVIPTQLTPEFRSYRFPKDVRLAQHGYTHTNYAPGNMKNYEFGSEREHAEMVEDIAKGHQMTMSLANAINTFVPPWNRFDKSLLSSLKKIGIKVLSTFSPRSSPEPYSGLRQVNTHADLVDWGGTRGFIGDASILHQITSHLSARRTGIVDKNEPTGLLTHHLVHDADCWRFLESFAKAINDHPAATWLPIDKAMAA